MKKDMTLKSKIIIFFKPTKWKIIIAIALYFSNYITLIGTAINFPIFYFYWNYPDLTPLEETVLFAGHALYAYVLATVVVKIFG